MTEDDGALTQLRAWLAHHGSPESAAAAAAGPLRLPPERDLAESLGVSRGALRKALAVLEANGELWRHVGKGTFLGPRPSEKAPDLARIASATGPYEVMRARLLIEPALAREAALRITASDLAELDQALAASRRAVSWRAYEACDNRFHAAIAQATHNPLLVALADTLAAVRRAVVWGRLRAERERPPADHHSFADHEAIRSAIAERDMAGAGERMTEHLERVGTGLLNQAAVAAE